MTFESEGANGSGKVQALALLFLKTMEIEQVTWGAEFITALRCFVRFCVCARSGKGPGVRGVGHCCLVYFLEVAAAMNEKSVFLKLCRLDCFLAD